MNGRPLRFYHFSGFDPLRPYALSKHQVGTMRIRLEDQFEVALLCDRYADAGSRRRAPWRRSRIAVPVRTTPRTVCRSTTTRAACTPTRWPSRSVRTNSRPTSTSRAGQLPDPFDADDADVLRALAGVPGLARRPEPRCRATSARCYDDRPDIAAHFPEVVRRRTSSGFVDWMRMHGRSIGGVLPEYVPRTDRAAAARARRISPRV